MNNPITQNKNNPFNKVGEVCQTCKSPEITYFIHLICIKCSTMKQKEIYQIWNLKYVK